jgi:hypothetical protein
MFLTGMFIDLAREIALSKRRSARLPLQAFAEAMISFASFEIIVALLASLAPFLPAIL